MRAASAAAVAAAALTAGLLPPPAAAAVGQDDAAAAAQPSAAAPRWITLITGDRIAVDDEGEPVTVEQAEGRQNIPVQIQQVEGHTYAVPLDAQRLIDSGRVDRTLFDLTVLSRPEYLVQQKDGIQLIVTYKGAEPPVRTALRATGTEVRRTLTSIGAEAVVVPRADATEAWNTLTAEPEPDAATPFRTAAPGVTTVWLDAVVQADLDRSVPQIGAPEAWAAGYNGTGVKIAVLDSGVDQTHPDLAGQEIAEKNFSTSPDNKDRVGHGTHVASTAAGTGAMSAGKYKGVAPGAQILDGKVLGDTGSGSSSATIAGMEWAVAQGADVANLSLGGADTMGTDPLEAAVNTLSAKSDTLFVIASGNSGAAGPGSLNSPGSADAALTVGAVDKSDKLAGFSSSGPRLGDNAIKPDVTAPGVDIGAAAAPGSQVAATGTPVADGYVAISGTSMATPHVAGAAAILAQQHPDWTGEQIKATLTGSAVSGAYSPFQQGTGRIDLRKAVGQSVVATSGSLSFGKQAWPHTDNTPVTKTLTYRNLGSEPVTLDMAVSGTGPDGKPAPDGLFTTGDPRVTVPANGEATVSVTADVRLGTLDGVYSAYVTASGESQSIRTAAAVEREPAAFDVSFKTLGLDGQAAKTYGIHLVGVAGAAKGRTYDLPGGTGTDSIRLTAGRYFVSTSVHVYDGPTWVGASFFYQPNFQLTADTTVTVDARDAKPVDIAPPDAGAKSLFGSTFASVTTSEYSTSSSWSVPSFAGVSTAHVGAQAAPGELRQRFQNTFQNSATGAEYQLAYGLTDTTYADGFERHPTLADLAEVTVGLGSSLPGKRGYLFPQATTSGFSGTNSGTLRALPADATLYLSTENTSWSLQLQQLDSRGIPEAIHSTPSTVYAPGKEYRRNISVGVFGPELETSPGGTGSQGLFRTGDEISGSLPIFADGEGNTGYWSWDTAATTLQRNGEEIGANTDPLTGSPFTVPEGEASYRLSTTVTRSKTASVSGKVTVSWTFRSGHTDTRTALPASVVRFTPPLAGDSTAPAGGTLKVPVTVQGAAAGPDLKSLLVYVSYDDGAHWTLLPVLDGTVCVKTPEAGGTVSLKAQVLDRQGNTVEQTIHTAYRAK